MINKLKKNGFINFLHFCLGDLFIKGLLFITLPILTFFLTPSEYGQLSVISTLITILAVFFSLNTENSIINYYMRKEGKFGSFLFSNIITLLFFQIILFSLVYLYKKEISVLFNITSSDLIWVCFICMIIFYFNVYSSYLQGDERSKEFAIINTVNKIIEISLIILFSYMLVSNKYLSKVYAQSIAIVIFLPYVLYKLHKIASYKYDISLVKQSLLFSLPLIPHVLSSSIIGQSDRLMINKFLTSADTGIYSFAYNLGLSITVLIYAWNSMWQPKFYKLYKEKNTDEIKAYISLYSKVISFSSIILLIIIIPVVKYIINPEYIVSIKIIPIIMIANALMFNYLVYVNYAFYLRRTVSISIASVFAAIINIIINYLFIPRFGIIIAVISTLVSSIALILIHYLNAKRISEVEVIPLKDTLLWFFPLIIVVAVFYYVTYS